MYTREPAATDAAVLAPPPLDWHEAATASPGHRDSMRSPARDAEKRVEEAEQRAAEAERRAAEAEEHAEHLERALVSRPAIEQSKGLLMAVFGVDADQAFESLKSVSQHSNVKIARLAEQLIEQARDIEFGSRTANAVTRTLARLGEANSPNSGT